MKISTITCVALAALATATAQPQPVPVYSTSTFYHVEDGKAQAFVEFTRTHTKKLQEALMKEDPALRATILTSVMYGGNPQPRANYVLSFITEGAPIGRAKLDAAARKVLGMSYADYLTKASAYRTRVGQVLSVQMASAGTENAAEGDIIGYDYMKIADGQASEYFAMERNDFQPIHEQRIKKGGMKRWSLWSVRVPGGDDRHYDATTTQVYKDLESALAPARFEALAREVAPNKGFAATAERARTTRRRVRSELRRVIWVVARP
jgi:hypothetical protein